MNLDPILAVLRVLLSELVDQSVRRSAQGLVVVLHLWSRFLPLVVQGLFLRALLEKRQRLDHASCHTINWSYICRYPYHSQEC